MQSRLLRVTIRLVRQKKFFSTLLSVKTNKTIDFIYVKFYSRYIETSKKGSESVISYD